MMRCLTAALLVFGLAASQSQAHYIMIKVELKKLLEQDPNGPPPSAQPAPGGFQGNPAFPGGNLGVPGGNLGVPGGNDGGGFNGGAGLPGGQAILGGFGGNPGQPGGNPAAQPGAFPGVGDPGGFPPGVVPPGMVPGQNPFPGLQTNEEPEAPQWVYAHIELSKKPKVVPGAVLIDHQWGSKTLVPMSLIRAHYFKKPPLLEEFKTRKDQEAADGNSPSGLRNLALWSLRHGLLKEFHETMAELIKKDSKHPSVAAYLMIKEALAKTPKSDDPANAQLISDLQTDGYRSIISSEGHYNILTSLSRRADQQAEAVRRLVRMEDTMATFYYWFAMQYKAVVLPVPRHRLLAVLVNNAQEFNSKHAKWGKVTRAADGFTPVRENVMILSRYPLDDAYVELAKNTEMRLEKNSLTDAELLSGRIWKRKNAQKKVFGVALLQTQALMKIAMERASERTTITHEGTLQLLRETGLLPRHVLAPRWIQSGLAGLFQTAYGAFYSQTTLPNSTYLVDLKRFREKKKLDDPKSVLLSVVTDEYFEKADATAEKLAKAKGKERKKLETRWEEENRIAHSTSWALVYYLVHNNKQQYLLSYCKELDQLPRDFELNRRILKRLFGKSFGVASSKHAGALSMTRVDALGKSWFAEMRNVSLEITEMELEYRARLDPPPPAPPQNPQPGVVPGQPPGLVPGQPGLAPPGGAFPGGNPGS